MKTYTEQFLLDPQRTKNCWTIGGGNSEFSKLEIEKSSKFECKPREEALSIKFNGMWIDHHEPGGFIIHQNGYCESIQAPETPTTVETISKLREKLGYVSSSTRPDLSYNVAHLSHDTQEYMNEENISLLQESVKLINRQRHIVISDLDINSLYIAGYADASFANNQDLSVMFTDSKSLFDTITKLSTIAEKRILIDVAAIRQSYSTGELTNVAHVLFKYNICKSFHKRKSQYVSNLWIDVYRNFG